MLRGLVRFFVGVLWFSEGGFGLYRSRYVEFLSKRRQKRARMRCQASCRFVRFDLRVRNLRQVLATKSTKMELPKRWFGDAA
ncbi:hypothetical protein SAMN04488037_11133 [Shimia marina]|uniref:Uncharacterized protein n=1 Tax=Shimia marina TaxID=321267 RepID=A0A0P1EK34_9RHOB|nr:hypothetical protein SHM7688_00278 [Shimia marina]SFE54684.1 hypothetical protein SAMN04488037_11133 [Shimia marina]